MMWERDLDPPPALEVVPLSSATWQTTYNLSQAKLGGGRTGVSLVREGAYAICFVRVPHRPPPSRTP
ncbi:hypothetical protein Q31b_06960 [Novipirellula aureliae]|uniref:Uncharacterized protein n=1 Tax=Novipirellula aureliae TaxID=2527966 RepID=A0A5C6E7A3_9BACT|nr:hypothetical protein Q31b_06960 [Novipirellula aureliae]